MLPLGDLLAYLNPPVEATDNALAAAANGHSKPSPTPRLVRERRDVQLLLFGDPEPA
jgi:hypothetical protein